jgi:hypothetical protein
MDAALLIVGIIGTLAAIAAAVFSYPPWRERLLSPDLELRVRNLAGYQRSGQIVTKANLEFEVHNNGKGEATTWRVELHTRGPSRGSLRVLDPRNPRPGEELYQLSGRIEVVAWRAVNANEVIPPGDKSRGLGPTMIDLPSGADFVSDYTLTARRMKPRTGTVTVTHIDPPEARVT